MVFPRRIRFSGSTMFRFTAVSLRFSGSTFFRIVLCFFLLFPAFAPIFAQSAQLTGVVHAPDQSVVPNARVTLTSLRTGVSVSTSTNSEGAYLLSLAPGTYKLVVRKSGFADFTLPSVTIAAGQSLTQNISLAGGAAHSTVTVYGSISGTPATGYHVGHVAQGVLGTTPVINLPYSVSVLPSDVITNTQARSLRDSLKYLPLVAFQEQQGSEVIRLETRGMEGANMQNTRMDGMGTAITGANAMEQYQSLEVVSGLGAAMYGPANPSGMFNFILKRPTERRTANLFLDYDSKSIGTAYADLGGRFGPHKLFGYRSNLLFGSGTAFVDDSFLRRLHANRLLIAFCMNIL